MTQSWVSCTGWPGATRVAAMQRHGDPSCLGGVSWVPARQLRVAQNLGGCFAVWRETSGKREPGRVGEQLAHLCQKLKIPSRLGALWQRDKVDRSPTLAQLRSWRGAFPLQACQLPGTKSAWKVPIWNVPVSACSRAESLSGAGRKHSPGIFHVLQEGCNQLPRTSIKRIGTENRTC